ncbi:hypothetical protein HPB47_020256 [Ixodes persulcatus]|uniref:Uncharacterized protein n=1 Tax=Ixodes persulcatus TaxID=34615 RepID=A0AC60QIJ0_IXOPE|nr:hypothetical protein HPB47_020256 [Ixodes persulcatus]
MGWDFLEEYRIKKSAPHPAASHTISGTGPASTSSFRHDATIPLVARVPTRRRLVVHAELCLDPVKLQNVNTSLVEESFQGDVKQSSATQIPDERMEEEEQSGGRKEPVENNEAIESVAASSSGDALVPVDAM